jgi:hypothetical protein
MWASIDKYHLRNGDWTISKMKLANGAKYALWHGNVSRGFYETADEAKAKFIQLTEGK